MGVSSRLTVANEDQHQHLPTPYSHYRWPVQHGDCEISPMAFWNILAIIKI
jgi:hypothetical protein